MLSKLLLGASQKLTERVVAEVTLPALGFWFVGIVVLYLTPAYALSAERIHGAGAPLLGLWATTLLGAIVVSAGLVSWLAPQISRLLLGEWPHWLRGLRAWSAGRMRSVYERRSGEWQALARKIAEVQWESLTAEEVGKYQELERILRGWPSDQRQIMPTRLGNLLRAAESRTAGKYGLEVAVVWPRLELVIPRQAQQSLNRIQEEFRAAASAATWSAILPLWVIAGVMWDASGWRLVMILVLIPLSAGLFVAAYHRCVLNLEQFGETFEATFDLFRIDLYRAVRFPLPGTPAEEFKNGRDLTAYLLRGSQSSQFHFAPEVGVRSGDERNQKDDHDLVLPSRHGSERGAGGEPTQGRSEHEPPKGGEEDSESDSNESDDGAEEESERD